jgi:16S rRNA (cytosine1402-N4)-methyltransferase
MHKPVMLQEVLRIARETGPRRILDCTFGRGGHTSAFLENFPGAKVTAIDHDREAVEYGQAAFAAPIKAERLRLEHFNFHRIARLPDPPPEGFDVILADLGVSSPQLDQGERGFSFNKPGPLDMRMDQSQGACAADIVNTWPEVELLKLFGEYGEVRRPQRVVRALVHDRKQTPFTTTGELAGLIERVEGWRKKGQHPATKFFLALRLKVNDELSGLEASVPDLMRALSRNGRLIVITFHSLEDRIIKYAFRGAPDLGHPLFKKVIVPSEAEIEDNPRARSAKLRVFQRGSRDEPPTPE